MQVARRRTPVRTNNLHRCTQTPPKVFELSRRSAMPNPVTEPLVFGVLLQKPTLGRGHIVRKDHQPPSDCRDPT